jgi:transposase-like protein
VIHLLRNTFRYTSRKYWDEMAKDLRPIYTAPTEAAAKDRFDEFTNKWGAQYPAIIKLWRNAWSEFVPFLDYDVEIRRVICSTDEIVNPSLVAGCCAEPELIKPWLLCSSWCRGGRGLVARSRCA